MNVKYIPDAARLVRHPLLTLQWRKSSNRPCGPCAQKVLMDLQCKVALITGGTGGIGYATAHELLNQNLYRVVLGGIDPCEGNAAAKKLNDCHGKNKSCFIPLNVNNQKQFEEAMKEIINKFGNLDILVNSASAKDSKEWEMMIDTNMKSVIYGTTTAQKLMKNQKNKEGVIINITDIDGFLGSTSAPIYSASKGGATLASKGLAEKGKVRTIVLATGPTAAKGKGGKKGSQKPSSVANGVVYVAQFGESGTVWAVEDGQLMKVIQPDWRSFAQKETTV